MSASSLPRIAPEASPSAEQQELLAKTLHTPSGRPINLFSTLVRHPQLMKRVNALGGLFMVHSNLTPRQREIVILRVAGSVNCAYEQAQHVSIAQAAGLSSEEIRAVSAGELPPGWEDRETVLIRMTDELLENLDLSDSTWAELSRHYGERELMELMFLPGFYRMLAGFLTANRVQVDDELASTVTDLTRSKP